MQRLQKIIKIECKARYLFIAVNNGESLHPVSPFLSPFVVLDWSSSRADMSERKEKDVKICTCTINHKKNSTFK